MIKLLHLVVCLFVTTVLTGQACVLDSTWSERWDEELLEWQLPERTEYIYDDTLLSIQLYHTSQRRFLYEYDSLGHRTKRTVQLLDSDTNWWDANIRKYDYDEEGRLIKDVTEYMDESGMVIRSSTFCMSYDAYGNLTYRSSQFVYNGGANSRIEIVTYQNEYDHNGRLDTTIKEQNYLNDSTPYISKSRLTSKYDEQGNLICKREEGWDDQLDTYEDLRKEEYEYEQGLLTSESLFFDIFLGNLGIARKSFYIYDDENRLLREDKLDFDWDQSVESHFAYDYVYEDCGLIKERLTSYRNFTTNEWHPYSKRTYFYSETTATTQIESNAIEFYPNPATDRLYIDLEENISKAIVNVYNLSGQILLQKNLTKFGYIDLSILNPGKYVLHVVHDGLRSVGTFIKI